ncbi:MAG TPA: FAD-dependent monooxygenase [Coxiellaceae bacterium]|nr:FAD-dependent monooxygenase [Coxiellaceae bacterium]
MTTYRANGVIVGAGLVGLSLARALSRLDGTLEVWENHPLPSQAALSANSRPISLSYKSVQLLKTYQVWDSLKNYATPIQCVHVSNQGSFGMTRFYASDYQVPALGYVVPFGVLYGALLQLVQAQSNVTFYVEKNTDKHKLEQQAPLIIGCDGTASFTRTLWNIECRTENRHQIAISGTLQCELPHRHTAYERFTREGVVALLPLSHPHECAFVWSVEKSQFDRLNTLNDESVQAELQTAFGFRVGYFQSLTRTGHFPLLTQVAKTQVKPGFVLVGNSAHTMYPIAAQGFNLCLRDVNALASVLMQTEFSRWGDLDILKSYLSCREKDQTRVMAWIQRMEQLFNRSTPGLQGLRSLSLLMTDLVKPLHHKIARQAMGF